MTPARVIAALALCFAVRAATTSLLRRGGPAWAAARLVAVELSLRGRDIASHPFHDDEAERTPLVCLQPGAGRRDPRRLLPLALILVDRTGGATRISTVEGWLFGSLQPVASGRCGVSCVFAMALPGDRALVAVVCPPGLAYAVLEPGDSWGEVLRGRGGSDTIVRAVNSGRASVAESGDW